MRLLILAAMLLAIGSALPVAAESYSASSLAAEARRLETQVLQGREINVAPVWDVETSERSYSISTEPERSLVAARRNTDAAAWLDQVASELEASEAAGPATDAREKLGAILARREFAGLRPPSAWELLRQRIVAWIGELLDRLFSVIGQHPTASHVLFWVLIAGAGSMLLLWAVRLGQRERTALNLNGPVRPIPPRAWAEWLAAARLAAEQGDLRQAIHCSYWAGVARLQETGVLTTDLTHTPREYLRLAGAVGTAPVTELAALTSGLERFWYAGRGATAEDFGASLKHLEALGCRTE